VAQAPIARHFDRRNFINGRWVTERDADEASVEIASILVQALPQRLDDAARAIEAIPGAQIYSRDPKGKLVIVIEASSVSAVGAALNAISAMPTVLTAALVFHGTDERELPTDADT